MRCIPVVIPLLLMAAVGVKTASARQVPGTWEIVPSPNADPAAGGNTLLAVDAISPSDAWAVGFHHNPAYCTNCPEPLIIHWDGAQWLLVDTPTIAMPKVRLTSVAAVSSDNVWAVGYSIDNSCGLCGETLIEHWDGTSWSVVPSPNPGLANALYAVAAASANDIWAVGDQWLNWSTRIALILHYNGTEWTVVSSPTVANGDLRAVHALAPDDVWAVGTGLTLHWNGTSWTQVPLPSEAGYLVFTGVSGAASDDVWAVGNTYYSSQSGQTLSSARAFHWNGSTWTQVLFPGLGGQDSRFHGVAAVATNDVWAVGGQPGDPGSGVAFEYVTAHWDGMSWSTVDTPNQGVLYAIAASSSADVWAVGFGFNALGLSTGTHTLRYSIGGCPFDVDGSGAVDVSDLLTIIQEWGACAVPANCPPDVNHSGAVDVDDLLAVISAWGPC